MERSTQPRAGGQSPPLEAQRPQQGKEALAPNPNQQGAAPSLEHSQQQSDKEKTEKLASNPGAEGKHELEDKAKGKMGL